MKLVRFGPSGQEKPGFLDVDGRVRDASSVVSDWTGHTLDPDALARIGESVDVSSLPVIDNDTRFGACVGQVGKFICIGLNYRDHADETGASYPEEPVLFMKATSAICGPNDDVVMPRGATRLDWEVELGVVIGRRLKYADLDAAQQGIAGYCVINDISERAFQLERGGQWDKGKGGDTFGPVGPAIVTPDEIADVNDLDMYLEVNGERFQDGSTSNMIFDAIYVVSYVSQFMSLQPGDIISTGTPAGVGLGLTPPRYLAVGDRMELGISGLGQQRQTVVAEEG